MKEEGHDGGDATEGVRGEGKGREGEREEKGSGIIDVINVRKK